MNNADWRLIDANGYRDSRWSAMATSTRFAAALEARLLEHIPDAAVRAALRTLA
ncbi:MAG TPA: hypothetical protein PLE48_06085 [Thiobacillus sp.]|uniref:hypothetical protein n=1 Tax=Acidovorax sp. TaxID=1872122 RepID=UPI0026162727|nr:hypothetical protein [Acidovorax sp.]HQT30598.1 hypothetical protein [Thiobacillus sp.]HQT69972.1 hypothetical protein [Thiobacillus sp.]